MQALIIGEGIEATDGATHLMLRLGTSVQTAAVMSVVKVGRAAVPAMAGSERVRVVVAVAESEAGQEPRKRRFWEHSQNGGPQVGEPGAKMKRVQATPFVGAVACGGRVVRVVDPIWLGQFEYDSWALRWFQVLSEHWQTNEFGLSVERKKTWIQEGERDVVIAGKELVGVAFAVEVLLEYENIKPANDEKRPSIDAAGTLVAFAGIDS